MKKLPEKSDPMFFNLADPLMKLMEEPATKLLVSNQIFNEFKERMAAEAAQDQPSTSKKK